MEQMFELDVQVQSTASQKEVSWFTQSLFCSMNTNCDFEQDPM